MIDDQLGFQVFAVGGIESNPMQDEDELFTLCCSVYTGAPI